MILQRVFLSDGEKKHPSFGGFEKMFYLCIGLYEGADKVPYKQQKLNKTYY